MINLVTKFLKDNPDIKCIQLDTEVIYFMRSNPSEPFSIREFSKGSPIRNAMESFENELFEIGKDRERLNWLDQSCDIGKIRLDPDLHGTPFVYWNVWNDRLSEHRNCPANVREAIDYLIENETKLSK